MNRSTDKCYIDNETGEILYPSQYNAETGEYEGTPPLVQKVKFRIPIPDTEEERRKNHKDVKVKLKKGELVTAAIFLVPSMIFFHPVLWIITCLVEIMLHNWAHRKNQTLKNDNYYYKSPLHGIIKEFCGRCKEQNTKDKITRIQDMRNDKMRKYGLDYVRRVVT